MVNEDSYVVYKKWYPNMFGFTYFVIKNRNIYNKELYLKGTTPILYTSDFDIAMNVVKNYEKYITYNVERLQLGVYEKENWLYNVAYYSTVRLGSEVGAFLPFTMLLELQRQISSPIPGVSVFEMIGNLTSPQKFLRTVDRGFWKDHLYLEQYASYFIPGVKSILTASDVSTMRDQRRFFQNQGFSFDWITLSPDKER